MAMRQMNVLDLPPEMVLHIGSFLPLSCLAAFGLTCRSTWDLFKGQVTNLRELEKANFLLLLHKDLPGWMICQNDMIIRRMDSCCDPGHGPSDNDYFHHKLRWFYDRNSKPVKSLIPVPSISQPLFMLDYGHVNKVMMRHRYGAKFGMPLSQLPFSIRLSPFKDPGNLFDITLDFRIFKDKLYMHGHYSIKGRDLLSVLLCEPFQIDVCPHIHLEHNRRRPVDRVRSVRKPIQMPGTAGCREGNSCPCTLTGAHNPGWDEKLSWETCSYPHTTEITSCRYCPTDLQLWFHDDSVEQNFRVDFWRCVGDGLFIKLDTDWKVASLNEFNENGHALAFNGKILVPGESAKNFKSGLPVVGNELDDEDEMDMDDSG
ncbi:hypothetical protein IWZ00DRAFT_529986 [Phyllosticta capitalensis]|uniref:uncharacterized protein n=1 Tax=Phyllosticta capitalensis TaxID=121624 RepID=UPI003130DC29